MTVQCIWGQAINQGPPDGLGFDAFCANPEAGVFALSDGANSCPDSGKAAQWLCAQITQAPQPPQDPLDFEPVVKALHHDMLQRFPDTAATLVGVYLGSGGLRLVSVGDSEVSVFERRWWGRWAKRHTMPKDLDGQGHPSQLLASEVLDTVHQHDIPKQKVLLTLMMSDGPARVLPESSVLRTIEKLSHQTPSRGDLNYLCENLANEALALGCHDDVSVVLMWIRYG
jgi:serine/threonine protein phosphatase PrpC